MEIRSGWLERSLVRARENVQSRPNRLKPERYRTATKHSSKAKKTTSARSRQVRDTTGN
jgi:hypothetical protein